MNVLEKLAGSRPAIHISSDAKELEAKCDEMYQRYTTAYRMQYGAGMPAPKIMFLAMPWKWVEALEQEPGTLVMLWNQDDPMNNAYAIVDAWGIYGSTVVLRCTRSDGKECVVASDGFRPADVPKGIIDIAKRSILKDSKCPLKDACL